MSVAWWLLEMSAHRVPNEKNANKPSYHLGSNWIRDEPVENVGSNLVHMRWWMTALGWAAARLNLAPDTWDNDQNDRVPISASRTSG